MNTNNSNHGLNGTNGSSQANSAISVGMVLNMVRQWWWLAGPLGILLATGAGFMVWRTFVPEYQATAFVEIKPPTQLVYRSRIDSRVFVGDQVAYLKSELVLEPALAKVGAQNVPELRESVDPVAGMAKQLTVKPFQKSSIYTLSYTSSDPKIATKVANAVAHEFLRLRGDREDARRGDMSTVLQRLQKQQEEEIRTLKERVSALARDLLLSESGPPSVSGGSSMLVMPGPLAQLGGKLSTAKYEVMFMQQQLQLLKEKQAKQQWQPSEEDIAMAIERDPDVQTLRAQIDAGKSRLMEYESTLKNAETHPSYRRLLVRIQQDEDDLQDLRIQLRDGQKKGLAELVKQQQLATMHELEGKLEFANISLGVVQKQYDEELDKAKNDRSQALTELDFARADLVRAEDLLNSIEDQERKLGLEGELRSVNLLRTARVPTVPVEKIPWKKIVMFGFGAFCLPFGLAFLWELRVRRVSDPATLEQTSRLPVVGEIAALPMRRRGETAEANPGVWLFEESVDSLRTGLTLSEELKDVRVLAVTSACSQEGKTSISSQLAVSLARATGHKTLVIDGDMRSPDLHVVFDVDSEEGLAEVLTGECDVDDAIVPTFSANLDLLPAGILRTNPHKLVGNGNLKDLFHHLKKQYDYIVMDTPPLLSAAEALVMAKHADATLVCAMRNVSRSDQVRRAYSRLQKADANPVGIVLNGVPTKRYAYAYGKYGYARN